MEETGLEYSERFLHVISSSLVNAISSSLVNVTYVYHASLIVLNAKKLTYSRDILSGQAIHGLQQRL